MTGYTKLSERLSGVLIFLGGLFLFALMLHIVADVAMKYLFNRPITGTLEIVSWYYMVAIAFLPVAYVQLNKRHLTVEMFTMGLSDRRRAILDGFVEVLAIAYVLILTWLVFERAIDATRKSEIQDVTFFDLPVWPSRWILPLSFGTMGLVLIAQAVEDFRYGFTGRGRPAVDDASKGERPDNLTIE